MAQAGKGRGLLDRSWRALAVSFVGYVVGFIVILLVLDGIGMFQRQPQQAFVLTLLVPLVPFLILLAYSGRIEAVKGPAGVEIMFDESEQEADPQGTEQSSGRRTFLKTGGILAAIGAIWGVFSQRADLIGLLSDITQATESGDGESSNNFQSGTDTKTPGEPVSTPEYQTGGNLFASIEADLEDFDPVERGYNVSSKVLNPVYEGLMATDFQGRPQPYLAESVDIEGDTTVIITLREGITFHPHPALNNQAVTSEDVLSTLERYQGTPFEAKVGDWYDFGSGTMLDERTLEIELTRAYAPFIYSIGVPIVPKEVATGDIDLSRSPIGTGPYVLEEYVPDELVRLAKHEEYWLKDTDAFEDLPPNFPREGVLDTVTFKFISAESDQVTALKQGEIDLATAPPTSAIRELEDNESFTVAETPTLSFHTLVYPMHEDANTPFQNRKVRLGVNRLIPREAIVETVYDGIGTPAYTPISPAASPFSSEALQEEIASRYARYDREKAQSLLEEGFREVGFDTPFETSILVPKDTREQMVNLIGQSMEDTGFFSIEINAVEFSTVVENVLAEDSHTKNQLVTLGWNASWDPHGSVHDIFHSEQTTRNCCNINHYSNQRIDQLIDQGVATYDIEERAAIYQQLQNDIVSDSPVAFIRFEAEQSVYANATVNAWTEYPTDQGDFQGLYAPHAGKFTWIESA